MKGSSQLLALSSQERQKQNLLRWMKFNFVGGVGIGVQLASLAGFRSLLHLDYLLATALAVETAVIHNFLWHERFTWRDRPAAGLRDSLARLAKFNASNGTVSLIGNLTIMRALVGTFRVNYVAANLLAITVCSVANFLLSDQVVFLRGSAREGLTAGGSPRDESQIVNGPGGNARRRKLKGEL